MVSKFKLINNRWKSFKWLKKRKLIVSNWRVKNYSTFTCIWNNLLDSYFVKLSLKGRFALRYELKLIQYNCCLFLINKLIHKSNFSLFVIYTTFFNFNYLLISICEQNTRSRGRFCLEKLVWYCKLIYIVVLINIFTLFVNRNINM
jgi:hypothetical protein